MNGLLTGLLARRETGLIEEIEKLEKRIAHMENQANEGMWIAGDDMQLSQYTANRKRITLIPLNENSEALAAVRILRYRGFSREQIEKEWKRQESQDKKSELAIEFIHMLQDKGIDYSISGENIAVHGTLDLIGTHITSLPDNLSVDGGLYLCYTKISNLPDDLKVGGSLDLENTCITRLPNNLKVGGFIYLHPEKITNIAYRKFLRNGDYTVFAAWINGECCIVVNSMIYTLGEFFLGLPTTDVEQAARECVAELTQRWKGTEFSTAWINVFDSLPELDTPALGCWFSDNGNFVLDCYVRTYSADAGGWVWAVAEDFGDGHWLFDDDYPVKFWMPLPGKPELAGGAA